MSPTIAATENQTWVYDQWSENTCNTKLRIAVPVATPADRYDLVLKTSTGDVVSLAAVKVIKDYKTSFYVFHISDAHRWQGTYDTNKILKGIATTIDIANIINPEMVFETGDNHYANTNSASSTAQRTTDFYNGFVSGTDYIKGLNDFSAPVFSIPGNHDTPQKNYQLEPGYPAAGYTKVPSQFFNEYYGLQAHNFRYGNARFIGLNNAWFSDESDGVPNFQHQTTEAIAWLDRVGRGTLNIGYCHVMTPTPLKAFYDPLFKAGAPLSLILAGHCHWAGNTHTIKDYANVKITHSTYPLREVSRKAPFNLYRIDLVNNTYTAVGDSIGAHEGLSTADDYSTARLKLTYSKPNDGANAENSATIVNKLNFAIKEANVRFVVPKGSAYYVRNATIVQQFDGTNYHIIDATYDLEANSTQVVSVHQGVQPDLCPDDPTKMNPGICGCGVPEGTCPIPATDISLNTERIRMVLKTERQLAATVLPLNTTSKTIHWSSTNPAIATVNADGVVTAIATGTTSIVATTSAAEKSITCAVTVLPSTNTYQAEDAEYVGPVEVTNQPGYNGTGFLDYSNASNDYIKWNVYVPTDGIYSLTFRYAIATNNRPLKLTVNDEVRMASVPFTSTGSWANWRNYSTSTTLVEGNNTIMLTAIGSSGGNFDELTITGNGLAALENTLFDADGKSVRIYPNPLNSAFLHVDLKGYENARNVKLRILNLAGQAVFYQELNNLTNIEINTLNLLTKSVYTVLVESDSSKISSKLILN